MFNLPVVANNHSESLCVQTIQACSEHSDAATRGPRSPRNSLRLFPILNRGNSSLPLLFWTSHLFEVLVLPYKLYLIFKVWLGLGVPDTRATAISHSGSCLCSVHVEIVYKPFTKSKQWGDTIQSSDTQWVTGVTLAQGRLLFRQLSL